MVQLNKIDYTTDFDNLYSRMDDFDKFFRIRKISNNILKYIPGLTKIVYQGHLHSTETKRKYPDEFSKNKKVIKLMFILQQITILIFKMYIFAFQ